MSVPETLLCGLFDVMFTNIQLFQQLPDLIGQPSPPLEVLEFHASDFLGPDYEQSIELHRGKKADYQSALQFWVKSVQRRDWWDSESCTSYINKGKCIDITLRTFSGLITDYSCSLKEPLRFDPKGRFEGGMQMYNDWNDVSVIAEFEQEYLAFYWMTAA